MNYKISIDNLHCYAHHGVMQQETAIGADFLVSLQFKIYISPEVISTDKIESTVNYAEVAQLLNEEMQTPSKLLEHAAWRCLKKLFSAFPQMEEIEICIKKVNPPIKLQTEGISVSITANRNDFPLTGMAI